MSTGGQKSIQGRCPTCGQVVVLSVQTLSVEARRQRVECPRCGHRGTGGVFVDLEAPLPVVLVSADGAGDAASADPGWVVPGSERPAPDEAAYDEAMSHPWPESAASDEAISEEAISDEVVSDEVLSAAAVSREGLSEAALSEAALSEAALSEAALSEAALPIAAASGGAVRRVERDERTRRIADPRTQRVHEERTRLMGNERTLLMDNERTRFVLDSPFLKSEAPKSSRVPASQRTSERVRAAKAGAGDEERTHLLLDPLDLYDERETALGRAAATLRPLGQRMLALGAALEERMHGRWWLGLLTLAVASGLVPPVFEALIDDSSAALSLVVSILSWIGFVAFGITWLGTLRRDDGGWDAKVGGVRLQTASALLWDDIEQLGISPRHLKLAVSGRLLSISGLVGLAMASSRSIVRFVLGAGDPPSGFRFASGLLLLVGVVLLRRADQAVPKAAPGPMELGEAIETAARLPPIVDLNEALPPAFAGHDTTLHRIIFALSEWRARDWLDDAGYRAALERHLQRHLPNARVDRERWLGRSRRDGVIDLVIDDLVLVQVNCGFRAPSAVRVVAHMNAQGAAWPGKPMLLAIFDATREAVFESAATASLGDLHQRWPMLTLRMPTRSR